MLSSGNLSLINNDSIKNGLLELNKMYAKIASGEHHMRREYEQYLYDVNIKNTAGLEFFNLKPKYDQLERITAQDIPKSKHKKLIEDAQWQKQNQTFQNGLKLAIMNNSYLAGLHKDLIEFIQQLMNTIDKEINR